MGLETADSILIGGNRTDNADGTTTLDITAQNLLVQNDASTPLSAGEIVLAATSNLTVADGSVISATGTLSDPRIGAWTLVSAQSSLDPPNQLSITVLHGAVHVVMSGERHLDFTAKADGHETAVSGYPAFDEAELHKIDKRDIDVREKKNGSVVATNG